MKLKIRLEYSNKTPFFGLKLFFQRPLENFLLAWRTCSRYLKGPPNLALCVSKKIVTARLTNQILCQEKWKKLRFWKNEAQNQVRIFWQNLMFWAETFFQRSLENFSWTLWTCSRYLKGAPNQVLCLSTKSWPHDKPIRLYVRKIEKSWYFEKMTLKIKFLKPFVDFMNMFNVSERCA